MYFHLLLDGFSDGSLGVALDILGTAAHLAQSSPASSKVPKRDLAQRIVSLDGAAVRSSARRVVSVEGPLEARGMRAGDVLFVPGMFSANGRTVEQLLAREDVRRAAPLLATLEKKGVTIAASCSATFIMAASGLLDGRSATTSWWLAPEFARRFPRISLSSDRMVVDEGTVMTAGAALAHVDLVLAALARKLGPTLTELVTRYLLLDERASQARYVVLEHLRANDPALRKVERFVLANIERQVSLDELAHVAAMSARTLARRVHASLGMTPQEFVQRLRVRRAMHLLEATRDSVDAIAAKVGYADAAAFRRVFRRHAGTSPARLRAG